MLAVDVCHQFLGKLTVALKRIFMCYLRCALDLFLDRMHVHWGRHRTGVWILKLIGYTGT